MKSTKSGFDFQNVVENKLSLSGLFGKNIEYLSNIYSYSDLINIGVADIDKFLLNSGENLFLFKNYPLFNEIDESIEFCIKTIFNNNVIDCYIECKFCEVNGTAYQKLYHYLAEHRIVHMNNNNSFIIVVYDGDEFINDTKTSKHVQNIKENYIKYNYKQMILNINDFQNQFLTKLKTSNDIANIFKIMKNNGY